MENSERRRQLEALLRDDPQDAFLRYALALEMASAGDQEGAVKELGTLLTYAPDYVPAYLQAGKLSLGLGREAQARAFWHGGITQAVRQGNAHAAEEMQGMLDGLS